MRFMGLTGFAKSASFGLCLAVSSVLITACGGGTVGGSTSDGGSDKNVNEGNLFTDGTFDHGQADFTYTLSDAVVSWDESADFD